MSNENFEQRLARYEGHTETLPKDRTTKKIPTVEFTAFSDIPLVNLSKKNTIVIVRGKANKKYGLYYDSVGKLTSGIGHLVKQGEIEKHYKLTKEKAKAMFKKDITKHKQALEKVAKRKGVDFEKLDTSQQNSLTSMMFNTNLSSWNDMWGALKKVTSPDTSPEEKEKYLSLAGYEMLNSKRFGQVKSRAVEEADVFFPEDFEKIKWNKGNRNIIRDIKKDRKNIYETLKKSLETPPIEKSGDRIQEKLNLLISNLSPEDHQRFGRQPGRLYAEVQERDDKKIVGEKVEGEQETEGNQQTTQRIS